jgi:hypothetical protein
MKDIVNNRIKLQKIGCEICQNSGTDLCIDCLYSIELLKKGIENSILEKEGKLPANITKVTIPVIPLPDNKYYYSIHGVNTILYNLFKTEKREQVKYLGSRTAYFKLAFVKSSLFTIPILNIEILFFEHLNSKCTNELWKALKSHIIFFTGSVGDIVRLSFKTKNELKDIIQTPSILEYPGPDSNKIFRNLLFTDEQINEIKYFKSFPLTKVDLKDFINNTVYDVFQGGFDLFEEQQPYRDESEVSLDEIVSDIFSRQEAIKESVNDIDLPYGELPF